MFAREGELSVAEFDARLETLHTVFFGKEANTVGMITRRQAASKAYLDLADGIDHHHDFERLAEALGVDSP